MNDTNGYHNGNGNGNGNGHSNGKEDGVFGLVKKDDPILSSTAPQARRQVIQDTTLPFGCRVLYCYLIDCSLWPGVHMRRGVVRFPNSTLAERLGISERTIQIWKNLLRSTGRIWTTEKRLKNSYPMTVYNVVAIVGQAQYQLNLETEDGSLPEEDYLSNRKRPRNLEHDPRTGKFKKRDKGGSHVENPKSFEIENRSVNQAPTDINLPPSTETDYRPQRQPVTVPSGNGLPLRAAAGYRPERQNHAVEHGNGLPSGAAKDCRSPRKPVAAIEESPNRVKRVESKGEGQSPPQNGLEQAFKAWTETLVGRFPSSLEKTLARLNEQRQQAKGKTRELITRKMAHIKLVLDGPLPEWSEPQPKAAPAVKPAPKEPTPEEILDGAIYSRDNGLTLTAAQKKALEAR
jgi:hypothetical protein